MLMKYLQLFLLEILLACCLCNCSEEQEKPLVAGVPKIIINCSIPANYDQLYPNPTHEDVKDIRNLFWTPVNNMGIHTRWNSVVSPKSKTVIKWVFQSENPVLVTTAFQRTGVVVNPGDSIQIDISANGITYSGRGAAGLQLQHQLELAQEKFIKPMAFSLKISSVGEYLKWNAYLNQRLSAALSIIDTCSSEIPAPELKIIKANTIYNAEFSRAEAFKTLYSYRNQTKDPALMAANMVAICDSTLDGSSAQWLRACSDCSVPTWYFYQYNRIQAVKKNNFDVSVDSSMNSDAERRMVYYNTLKENYKGLLRERLLQYVVANETVKHLGFNNPVTDTILNDYYSQPGFPEYKQWMRKYVDSLRQLLKIAQK